MGRVILFVRRNECRIKSPFSFVNGSSSPSLLLGFLLCRSHRRKVRVLLRLLGGQSFLVVVSKQLVKEVNRFVGDVSLVVGCDELAPWLSGVTSQKSIVIFVQLDLVSLQAEEKRNQNRKNRHERSACLRSQANISTENCQRRPWPCDADYLLDE